MADTTTLICPKCRGQMRSYERNGVLIDQCEECRGIFLDRGELELLLDTEAGRGRREEYDTRSRGHDRHDHDHHDDDDHDRYDRHGGEDDRKKRRTSPTSFLSDLLGGGE